MNSFRWVHVDNYSRCSLVPVRYVAQSARSVCVTYLVVLILSIGFRFYECCADLEVSCFLLNCAVNEFCLLREHKAVQVNDQKASQRCVACAQQHSSYDDVSKYLFKESFVQ